MRSKLLISGIAATGALETGFLSYSRVFNPNALSAFCPDAGSSCSSVLSGPYSVIPTVDVPLVSVAFVAYTAAAGLAWYSHRQSERAASNAVAVEQPTDSALLMLTTAMATFSGYLMLILALVLHESCNFCFLSAFLSVSMVVVAWQSKIVPNATKAFVMSGCSAAITAVSSAFLFAATSTLSAPLSAEASTAAAAQALAQMEQASAIKTKTPPRITTHTSARAEEIAVRASQKGAKMYGAYWCSHCYNQKQLLGQEAMQLIPYIECDKEGANSQFPLCRSKNVS